MCVMCANAHTYYPEGLKRLVSTGSFGALSPFSGWAVSAYTSATFGPKAADRYHL